MRHGLGVSATMKPLPIPKHAMQVTAVYQVLPQGSGSAGPAAAPAPVISQPSATGGR